jgi:translocation and assembly module TamB
VLRPIPGTRADPWQERLLAAPLTGQLRFNGPAEALWPLAGIDGFDLRGPVAISADVAGRLGEPTITGAMRSRGARLESTVLGAVIDRIALDSRFDGSRLVIASLSGDAGKGGRLTGSGSIDLSAVRGFPIDLQLQAARAELIRRDDLRAAVTGPLRILSDADGSGGTISGDVKVDSARFRIGRTEVAAVPNLPVRETGERPLQALTRPRSPTPWQLRIDARAPANVDITGLGIQSQWSADLAMRGPADAPRITGSAELIRGTYDFAGRRFDITRGRMRFAGGYPPDPVLDIAAESRADGLTAQLRIEGTALRPEISFSSIPALPEDEVLSRLLFGTGVTNLSAPEAIQLAGAVAALRQGNAQNLDVLGLVRRGLGIDRLRILPGDTTKRRGTSVAVGEYLGNRVYVEVASDAQGYTATQIEVALTRSLSVLSQVATFGGTSVNLKWSKDY